MTGLKENYRRLKSDLISINNTLRFATALPNFFRERITLQQAEEQVKKLLDTRVERFLDLVRTQIYARPGSPYLTLLKHAGCEFADLQAQINRYGLEGSLAKLAGEGVYLSSDEFKGKTEVVRGGESFRVSPRDFEQRYASAGFTLQSSGTRNQPIKTFSALEWRTLQAMGEAIFYAANNLFSLAHAIYEPVIAGRMYYMLVNAKLGIPTNRWFAMRVPVHSALEDGYHYMNAYLIAMMGRWFGVGNANPEYLEMRDVKPILEWILGNRQRGKNSAITTVVSNAARIARMAFEMGFSLEGTKFIVSGEPLTQAKRKSIEDAGARIAVRFGPGGGNGCVHGCGNPLFTDEMHVPQNIFTFVEHPKPLDYGGPPIHPLMLTTLDSSAPRLLLNVENGDYATMIKRDCGCALEKVGFTQHLHTVRSFEKFTSEGMNFFGTDLFELLQSTMPSQFGGGPGDYQLVEEEDDNGQTRLTLLVNPDVGDLNEEYLLSRLQKALAEGSRNNRFMSKVWQNAGTFRVRREAPRTSVRGKILPLQIRR